MSGRGSAGSGDEGAAGPPRPRSLKSAPRAPMPTVVPMDISSLVLRERDQVVAVMGPPSSGKSFFLSDCAEQKTAFASSPNAVIHFSICPRTINEDVTIYFIDFPGVDANTASAADILRENAIVLIKTYAKGIRFNNILYFHAMSLEQMSDYAFLNLQLFRTLCGHDTGSEDVFRRVILVTTDWLEVSGRSIVRRMNEMVARADYFGRMVKQGARHLPSESTMEYSSTLINMLIPTPRAEPIPGIVFRIQREVVDEGLSLAETGAGKIVQKKLKELQKGYEDDLKWYDMEELDERGKMDKNLRKLGRIKARRTGTLGKIDVIKENLDLLATDKDALIAVQKREPRRDKGKQAATMEDEEKTQEKSPELADLPPRRAYSSASSASTTGTARRLYRRSTEHEPNFPKALPLPGAPPSQKGYYEGLSDDELAKREAENRLRRIREEQLATFKDLKDDSQPRKSRHSGSSTETWQDKDDEAYPSATPKGAQSGYQFYDPNAYGMPTALMDMHAYDEAYYKASLRREFEKSNETNVNPYRERAGVVAKVPEGLGFSKRQRAGVVRTRIEREEIEALKKASAEAERFENVMSGAPWPGGYLETSRDDEAGQSPSMPQSYIPGKSSIQLGMVMPPPSSRSNRPGHESSTRGDQFINREEIYIDHEKGRDSKDEGSDVTPESGSAYTSSSSASRKRPVALRGDAEASSVSKLGFLSSSQRRLQSPKRQRGAAPPMITSRFGELGGDDGYENDYPDNIRRGSRYAEDSVIIPKMRQRPPSILKPRGLHLHQHHVDTSSKDAWFDLGSDKDTQLASSKAVVNEWLGPSEHEGSPMETSSPSERSVRPDLDIDRLSFFQRESRPGRNRLRSSGYRPPPPPHRAAGNSGEVYFGPADKDQNLYFKNSEELKNKTPDNEDPKSGPVEEGSDYTSSVETTSSTHDRSHRRHREGLEGRGDHRRLENPDDKEQTIIIRDREGSEEKIQVPIEQNSSENLGSSSRHTHRQRESDDESPYNEPRRSAASVMTPSHRMSAAPIMMPSHRMSAARTSPEWERKRLIKRDRSPASETRAIEDSQPDSAPPPVEETLGASMPSLPPDGADIAIKSGKLKKSVASQPFQTYLKFYDDEISSDIQDKLAAVTETFDELYRKHFPDQSQPFNINIHVVGKNKDSKTPGIFLTPKEASYTHLMEKDKLCQCLADSNLSDILPLPIIWLPQFESGKKTGSVQNHLCTVLIRYKSPDPKFWYERGSEEDAIYFNSTLSHMLPEHGGNFSEQSLKFITPLIPRELMNSITFENANGARPCWTYMKTGNVQSTDSRLLGPAGRHKRIPLTLASAPVVVPVPYKYPPVSLNVPPSDPRPEPIDPSLELLDETVAEIFSTFEHALGFYLLINGWLQVIVPNDFNFEDALADQPVEFGGLKVSYIHPSIVPTAGTSSVSSFVSADRSSIFGNPLQPGSSRSTSYSTEPRPSSAAFRHQDPVSYIGINKTIVAHVKKPKTNKLVRGKIGLVLNRGDSCFVTIPSHTITKKLNREKITEFAEETWAENVTIYSEDGKCKIGPVTKTYDPKPGSFPQGFPHDVSVVGIEGKPTDLAAQINLPYKVDWLNESIDHSKDKLCFLHDHILRAKYIPLTHGQYQVVGQALFKSQPEQNDGGKWYEGFRKKSSQSAKGEKHWKDAVSRAILFRASEDVKDVYMSGAAVCVLSENEGQRSAKVAGFTAFAQIASHDYDAEDEKLYSLLNKGSVSFFGAFLIPEEMRSQYRIINSLDLYEGS